MLSLQRQDKHEISVNENRTAFQFLVPLTLSIMNFQHSKTRNVVSQQNLVGSRGLVHALYDLKVTISKVEVVLVDSHTPGMRKACHYGDTVSPIWITTLDLREFGVRQSNVLYFGLF